MKKFDGLIQRLTNKVTMSATPVPGFILGLSGTDSIATFLLLYEVYLKTGVRIQGVHYLVDINRPQTLFQKEVFPWLREKYADTFLFLAGTNNVGPGREDDDTSRWADLHYRARTQGYWTVSTVNATEKALGTYGIMANAASIAPIQSLYKSEVLQVCEEYNVPQAVINASRIPDCLCGRDEFAAENIQLIDDVLRYNLTKDYTAEELKKAMDYIRDNKRDGEFKSRTPYNV